jgi:hypothetical protein
MRDLNDINRLIAATEAELSELYNRRSELIAQVAELQREKTALLQPNASPGLDDSEPTVTNQSSQEEKVALFRSLFRGREDVYPRRFESIKTGKKGYQPVCRNEWVSGICEKPKIRCEDCAHREFLPITDIVIRNHLQGFDPQNISGRDFTIGVYPMLTDESCWFLVVDFDKASWQEDARAFLETCLVLNVPAALERSRSGSGGHVWMFFAEPVPAALARQMGAIMLTQTLEHRPEIGLDSYDRLFPSQDTLPKGGFGNLIALPLQKKPRENGNSVFVNEQFDPFPDQWAFLASLCRISQSDIEAVVKHAEKQDELLGIRLPVVDEDSDHPWAAPPSRKREDAPVIGPLPEQLDLVLGNQIYIPKADLTPSLRNRLIRLAAFQNPEFYRAQGMRLSTFLGLSPKEIGQIGGGKHKPNGKLDVAMIQSLGKQGVVDDIVGNYGHLVVDECHHISAVSFEQVVRQNKAQYLTGLSATVTRKDGHQPIIFMQCGPVRYKVSDRAEAAKRPFEHKIVVRPTSFHLPMHLLNTAAQSIQELYTLLASDEARNRQIIDDVVAAVQANRFPVLLTERRDHLEALAELLSKRVAHVFVMKGGMGKKQRCQLAEQIANVPSNQPRVILATGRYLGEGFDDERLDTLFLALPISWRGTLTQYAGRLHRLNANKKEVVIYDYVDFDVPVLAKMYAKRRAGYKAIGYEIELPTASNKPAQLALVDL